MKKIIEDLKALREQLLKDTPDEQRTADFSAAMGGLRIAEEKLTSHLTAPAKIAERAKPVGNVETPLAPVVVK